MCGVAGIIGAFKPLDNERVHAMVAVQKHRGPDYTAVEIYPGAVLGHTRLSIIDLTDRARQPMETTDHRYSLVFNGEIYNYKELRHQLRNKYRFVSESDTEVILAAYVQWGEGCLEHLNGMFAFCIYDQVERSAFFARDRFGQKPFYFVEQMGRLMFASEVKALLAAGVTPQPDLTTWARYLLSASYDDDDATFFSGVTQLTPGECATWNPKHGIQRRRYYNIADRITYRNVDIDIVVNETRELLFDATRTHMRADVPIGISLSGGLDSSALLACLDHTGKLHDGVACISVEFGEDLTERPWIEAAAGYHGVSSWIEPYSPEEFCMSIRPMMWHLEGPIGGLMNCALAKVMQSAHAAGFKVIQDGTGLDEAFAGYRNNHNLYLGLLLREGGPLAEQAVREYARNWEVSEKQARHAGELELQRNGTAIDGTVPVRPELLEKAFVANYASSASTLSHTGDQLRDALIDNLQIRKIPRNTRMKDRVSMAYALELRLPFLDHRLMEHALSVPTAYYFLHGRSKSLAREALAGVMDDNVRTAVKRSIQSPQGPWLAREPMRSYVRELISSESFADRGLFNVAAVHAAYDRFCTGGDDNSFFVWQWINVEEWFRIFVDNDAIQLKYPLCPGLFGAGVRQPGTH